MVKADILSVLSGSSVTMHDIDTSLCHTSYLVTNTVPALNVKADHLSAATVVADLPITDPPANFPKKDVWIEGKPIHEYFFLSAVKETNVCKKESSEPMKSSHVAFSVPEIVSVVHNEAKLTTTINWADDTKTTVRVMSGETYDKYNGFCAAVMKKLFGTTTMAKRIRDRKDIVAIKAKRDAERQKTEAAAAERRAILERREAKKRVKDREREERISAMMRDIQGQAKADV